MKKEFAAILLCAAGLFVAACNVNAPSIERRARVNFADTGGRYILQCKTSCDSVAGAVTAQGGRVLTRFRNVSALTVALPPGAVSSVTGSSSVKSYVKDFPLALPDIDRNPLRDRSGLVVSEQRERSIRQLVDGIEKSYNNMGTGAESLHKAGYTGKGVVVAVIDSGVANNADVVPVLAGSVIGGENFIDLPQEPSATSTKNDDHGTMVGTVIAGHATLNLNAKDPIAKAMVAHASEFISQKDARVSIPVIGTAPESKLYSLKVFPALADNGTLASIVLQAMDRVITLKRNFDAGGIAQPVSGNGGEEDPYRYDALNIRVVNLSLGGEVAFYPGFEVDDLLTIEMINAGMVVTTAGGNEGPANLTIESPAAGYGALAVGAANIAIQDRVIRELLVGAGLGAAMRPTDYSQMALFSSRGPLPDGRLGIHLAANGVGLVMQGAGGSLDVASGTSFSAPQVAGAAAALLSSGDTINVTQVRQALIDSADATRLGDGSGPQDQGNGLLNLPAALALLKKGVLPTTPPIQPAPTAPTRVADNMRNAGYPPVALDEDGQFKQEISVIAGQVAQFMIPVPEDAAAMKVALTKVKPVLPADQQNAVNGDKLVLTIMDAARTAYPEFDKLIGKDTEWTLVFPQTGLARVAVAGMRYNAGAINAILRVSIARRALATPLARGTLVDEESKRVRFVVPPDTQQLIIELSWRANWAFFPTHDLDMAIFDPAGDEFLDKEGYPPGATIRSPERVVIDAPTSGIWTARIDGYMLHGLEDRYELRVTDQDGKPIAKSTRR